MTQRDLFTAEEANAWYHRNKGMLSDKEAWDSDPLVRELKMISAPKRVLEIGCADGWRLAKLQLLWPKAELFGVDPSSEAINEGAKHFPGLKLSVGSADSLPFADHSFDMVLFGFCLYLVDRNDLFKVASEADRLLKDGGCLGLFDFYSPLPYANPYSHCAGVHSYKMDYARMWSWNPAYFLERQIVTAHEGTRLEKRDDAVTVTILKKDLALAWPSNPY